MSKIPNTEGPIVKKGDLVKITQGEWIGFVGEIVEMVQDGKNIIKTIKVLKDGKITLVQVKDLTIDFVSFADKVIKSNVFKRFSKWIVNLFRKKKNKPQK
jgi:hypothetical protein